MGQFGSKRDPRTKSNRCRYTLALIDATTGRPRVTEEVIGDELAREMLAQRNRENHEDGLMWEILTHSRRQG